MLTLKENRIAYSNVSASQSTTIPSPKKNGKSVLKSVKIIMIARNRRLVMRDGVD